MSLFNQSGVLGLCFVVLSLCHVLLVTSSLFPFPAFFSGSPGFPMLIVYQSRCFPLTLCQFVCSVSQSQSCVSCVPHIPCVPSLVRGFF